MSVNPIPEGFHTVSPHIVVDDGNAAIDFYKKAFGAEEKARMTGPDGKSIMHAELKIGSSIIMLNEEFPGGGAKSPKTLGGSPVILHLYVDDVDAFYDRAIKAGAKVSFPIADAFWGDRYGQVTDPFGHTWSLATHKKDLTEAEINKGAEEFFSNMGGGGEGQD